MNALEIMREIETAEENDLRTAYYELEGDGEAPPRSYPHQALGLDRIERGAAFTPPVSGILHYPTGAGKTRVGMEFIGRALHQNPRHRFVWATHTRTLIRQTMVRMAELSRLFPKGTCFAWLYEEEAKEYERDFHVVFMTRSALTEALDKAGDGRVKHAWSEHLRRGYPLTLIYDECHQLGADKLQQKMRKFYEAEIPKRTKMWRVIGLSATPVPTRPEAHGLLQQHVFPIRGDAPSTSHGWPFHVIQKVSNDALVKQGVLCRINPYLDEQALFDVSADLLRAVIGDARLKPPGPGAKGAEVQEYALQFNSRVLGAPPVIAFLAKRIGENLPLLGKTIVFVPTIPAANRLAGVLYETFPSLRGKVATVHSKMKEFQVPGQEPSTVHGVLDKFRRLGEEHSILINVDMLTEGFDDPKVHAVVLARLTLSTNRFWQMIGRGTRGRAAKGTSECIVIDPVKLTRLYDYFSGYQPSFAREDEVEFEDLEEKAGNDLISPVIPQVSRPPDPSTGVYTIDPELERVHAQVALALRHFLRGEPLSEAQALDAAHQSRVKIGVGKVVLEPSGGGGFDATTATVMLLGEIASLERRAAADLEWFRQQLPSDVTESILKQRMRMLRAIESMRLWTESAFADAQMRGDFLGAMQREASGTPPEASAAADAPKPALIIDGRPFDPIEDAVLDSALAIAGADGRVDDIEVSAIAETLRRMCGRASTPVVEAAIRARAVPKSIPYERLEALLSPAQRQLLLWQMTEVVAADAIVTPDERAMLYGFAARLSIPEAFVESLVGANLARADVQGRVPQPTNNVRCQTCGSDTPAAGAFCTSCGSRLTT